jgi:hypothetical protein
MIKNSSSGNQGEGVFKTEFTFEDIWPEFSTTFSSLMMISAMVVELVSHYAL